MAPLILGQVCNYLFWEWTFGLMKCLADSCLVDKQKPKPNTLG